MTRILFMGSPQIAVPSLQALHRAGHEIVGVVTQPDRPKGRGQQLSPPDVKVAARGLGFTVLQPEKLKDFGFFEQVQKLAPELIVVVAYGKILPREILQLPELGCINLHFSLLPKYRGASCVAFALIDGEEETGVTTILMEEGLDTGPILMQWGEPIAPEDTRETLSLRLTELGAQQLIKTVEAMERGNIRPTPQPESGASNAPLLKKEQGRVDWSQDAGRIYNLFRGLTPWPGIFSFLDGRRILLTQVRLSEEPSTKKSGTIEYKADQNKVLVHCGSGALEILRLKPEGRGEMSASEFIKGLHSKEGLIFGSF